MSPICQRLDDGSALSTSIIGGCRGLRGQVQLNSWPLRCKDCAAVCPRCCRLPSLCLTAHFGWLNKLFRKIMMFVFVSLFAILPNLKSYGSLGCVPRLISMPPASLERLVPFRETCACNELDDYIWHNGVLKLSRSALKPNKHKVCQCCGLFSICIQFVTSKHASPHWCCLSASCLF